MLEAYAADNSILDLGCGSGMTALEMKNNFKEYVGVDVSEVAVEKAREALSRELDRAGKVSFVASDIYEFAPARKFSVILFRESIYYVPLHRIKSMLQRYSTHLLPHGVLIVRLCDRHRYKSIVKILELDFQGKEVFAANDSPMSIFICSPSDQGRKMREHIRCRLDFGQGSFGGGSTDTMMYPAVAVAMVAAIVMMLRLP